MELVEGPTLGANGIRFLVRVVNLSERVWSSKGDHQGQFAIKLGCRLLDSDGVTLQTENHVTDIPFVHTPGDALVLAITVDPAWVSKHAAFADIEMMQESVGWWGNPLRVPLLRQ